MKIIFMGPQGSGKSTQAELLSQTLGVPHLQMGEFYRSLATQDSPLGQWVADLMSKGQLIPDSEHNKIADAELKQPKYQKGFVLDGSPRTLAQAKILSFVPNKVFYLAVSDTENVKRLSKRGRFDDTPRLIEERLRLYHQETAPILDFYRQMGVLEEIDGERPIEVIAEDIKGRIRA